MDERQVLVLQVFLLLLKLTGKLRQFSILKAGGLIQVGLLFCGFDLLAYFLDLFTQLAATAYDCFLVLPLRLLGFELILKVRQLLLEIFQPFHGGLVCLLLQCCFLDLHLHDAAVHLIELGREGIDLCLDLRAGFIDQVDRLIRQEPVRYISVRQCRGGYQRTICDLHMMVDLITLLQPSQDRDRVFHGRLIHHYRLETPCQSGILLDVLAVLIQGRRTDAVQLAPCQHRLEHVAGIHGSVCLPRANDQVQFIDEENDLALAPGYLIEDRLQSFLKFAPVLGSGDQSTHIQREDFLILQRFRDIFLRDALRQPFDDRRLADAWLADQNRIVLGLAGKDPDHIPDLIITADDRVHLLLPGFGNQFRSVFGKCVIGVFRSIRVHDLVAPDRR